MFVLVYNMRYLIMKRKTAWEWIPVAASIGAVVACYGTLMLVAILSAMGIAMAVHEGAWAAVIVALAVIAALGVAINSSRTQSFGPLALAVTGAALVSWAMFGSFNRLVELAGFATLLSATIWDWRTRRARRA